MNTIRRSFLATMMVLLVAVMAWSGETKRVLVFGDSNTFGWFTNEAGLVDRFPDDIVWPGVMQTALGEGYVIRVEALGGRTTNLDGPELTGSGTIRGVGMNGAAFLPAALSSHMPLDLVIIMLGTNDLRVEFNRNAADIAAGIVELACIVINGEWQSKTGFALPRVLVISPPKVHCTTGLTAQLFSGSLPKTEALPGLLQPLAECIGAHFFDAATVVPFAGQPDQIHLTPDNHAALGLAVAQVVQSLFGHENN